MLFSVVIPAYKSLYLSETINSILSQTFTDFEVIIVDDCSPFDIRSVVNSFDDARIHYYRNEKNFGAENVVDNWNKCLALAKGEYIICMGDDDCLLPDCLDEYHNLIQKYPGIGVLHGWTEIIDENSRVISPTVHRCEYESAVSLIWHRWRCYNLQFIGDFCFNTAWLRANGGFFKLPLAWGSDDVSAFIAASKNGIANTQKLVFQYRENPHTISKTGNSRLKMEAILLEHQWVKDFISKECDDEVDELYRQSLLRMMGKVYHKRKAVTISEDLQKESIFAIFYWLKRKNHFQLSKSTLLRAVLLYIKWW